MCYSLKKKVHIIARIKGVKMISEKIMEQCLSKKIKVTYNDKSSEETFCEQFIRKEDDDDEAILFLPNNLVALQSEIESIEILD